MYSISAFTLKIPHAPPLPLHQHPAPQAQTAVRQKLAHSVRRAVRTITSAVRCDQPKVWSNSRSEIGWAPKSAFLQWQSQTAIWTILQQRHLAV